MSGVRAAGLTAREGLKTKVEAVCEGVPTVGKGVGIPRTVRIPTPPGGGERGSSPVTGTVPRRTIGEDQAAGFRFWKNVRTAW